MTTSPTSSQPEEGSPKSGIWIFVKALGLFLVLPVLLLYVVKLLPH